MHKARKPKKVRIIGAGFSGLSLAYFLLKKGVPVEIIEKDRVGGLLGTAQTPYGPAEQAANAIMASELFFEVCRDIGIEPLVANKQARRRYFYREDLSQPLTRWPLRIGESFWFVLHLLRFIFLFFFRQKLLAPLEQENLRAWGDRNFGQDLTNHLIQPAMNGIYASSVDDMNARLIVGRLFSGSASGQHKRSKKTLISFAGGMGEFVDRLHQSLSPHILVPRTFLRNDVSEATSDSYLVLATSAKDAALLFEGSENRIFAMVHKYLLQISYSHLSTATLFFSQRSVVKNGFGCLIAASQKTKALGILWNSQIFKRSSAYHSETWIFRQSEGQNSSESISQSVVSEVEQARKVLFHKDDPSLGYKVTHWQSAIPIYNNALKESSDYLNTQPLADQGIFFHGNYLGGIGLGQLLEKSQLLAENIFNLQSQTTE